MKVLLLVALSFLISSCGTFGKRNAFDSLGVELVDQDSRDVIKKIFTKHGHVLKKPQEIVLIDWYLTKKNEARSQVVTITIKGKAKWTPAYKPGQEGMLNRGMLKFNFYSEQGILLTSIQTFFHKYGKSNNPMEIRPDEPFSFTISEQTDGYILTNAVYYEYVGYEVY